MAILLSLNPTGVFACKSKLIPSASLSSPSGRLDTVDPLPATCTFSDSDSRPIMLFDGFDVCVGARQACVSPTCVCNLCNGGVKFVRDNDRNRRIRYEPLQSEGGKRLLRRSGRDPDDISSVVLVEKNGNAYIKSEAVLKIMEYIDLPFPQLAFLLHFVPVFLRDIAYDNVANNRYAFFGRSDSCEIEL